MFCIVPLEVACKGKGKANICLKAKHDKVINPRLWDYVYHFVYSRKTRETRLWMIFFRPLHFLALPQAQKTVTGETRRVTEGFHPSTGLLPSLLYRHGALLAWSIQSWAPGWSPRMEDPHVS